jgi:hypothetical protein
LLNQRPCGRTQPLAEGATQVPKRGGHEASMRVAGREVKGSQPLEVRPTCSREEDAIRGLGTLGTLVSRAWRIVSGVWRLAFGETECEADDPRLCDRHVASVAVVVQIRISSTLKWLWSQQPCSPAPGVFVRPPSRFETKDSQPLPGY